MAQTYNTNGPFGLRSVGRNEYFMGGRFDTNDTGAPDGVTPSRSGVTVARTDVGIFTVTLAPAPAAIVCGDALVWGDQAGIHAKVISYSAGVLTIKVYDEDNTSGIQAVAETNNVTVCWWAVFTSET